MQKNAALYTAIGCSVLIAILAGCKTTADHSSVPTCIKATDLQTNFTVFPIVQTCPVVDIHSHTFNARYLPIENIAQMRRYDKVPFGLGYLISNDLISELARWIVETTTLADTTTNGMTALLAAKKPMTPQEIDADVDRERVEASKRLFGPDYTPMLLMQGTQHSETPSDLKRDEKMDRALVQLLGGRSAVKEMKKDKSTVPQSQFWRFLYFLKRDEVTARGLLTKSEFPDVDLFVHHMMDLGPVYGQQPKGESFLDFAEQLRRDEYFDYHSEGKFIRFVAFSPFRARTEHGIDFEAAWKPVQAALDAGAWGVKFYPPSGYRPAGNDIPWRPLLPAVFRRQWDSRYKGFSDETLDKVMLQFFERCIQQNVPVFAHCKEGEFQAGAKYGERNADPKYWLQLFQQHTNLSNLRLCLGHAGGPDYWFDSGTRKKWGTDVVKLCTTYPNVYCEIGVLDEVVKGEELKNRVIFANQLLAEIKKSNGAFARKIMYGSDWFMPMKANPRNTYLNAYREIMLTPQLQPYYADFFCKNALSYLDLTDEKIESDKHLSDAAKKKLHALLAQVNR